MRTDNLHTYPCVGGPLDGLHVVSCVGDNLLVDAANGSYWASPLSLLLKKPDPLLRLAYVALWNESPRFCYPHRAILLPPKR